MAAPMNYTFVVFIMSAITDIGFEQTELKITCIPKRTNFVKKPFLTERTVIC